LHDDDSHQNKKALSSNTFLKKVIHSENSTIVSKTLELTMAAA
jgi:hypothetical protein